MGTKDIWIVAGAFPGSGGVEIVIHRDGNTRDQRVTKICALAAPVMHDGKNNFSVLGLFSPLQDSVNSLLQRRDLRFRRFGQINLVDDDLRGCLGLGQKIIVDLCDAADQILRLVRPGNNLISAFGSDRSLRLSKFRLIRSLAQASLAFFTVGSEAVGALERLNLTPLIRAKITSRVDQVTGGDHRYEPAVQRPCRDRFGYKLIDAGVVGLGDTGLFSMPSDYDNR